MVLLKGMTTNANGDFSFEDLPIMGALKIENICNRIQAHGTNRSCSR